MSYLPRFSLSSYTRKVGVLAIGAHPDDIELGCGASLARLAKQGVYIAAVVMTSGKYGTSELIDRRQESYNALTILGCKKVIHFDFTDTQTYLQLNDMISTLENVIKHEIPHDVEIIRVYTMHDADRHQDHIAVYQASMVACRSIPQILGYETPSTWLSFMPQVFESVEEDNFNLKLSALSKHKSQSMRDYMRPERLRAVAQFRGQQVNSELGEGFVIHKMIL
ncbi:PIG-L deacetylase family protein [Citrobacter braakii]|uniref:PIG-L deacetylase family protein n=1 Tax=Citrobacter braakii TaxID=57706 RepID=UPI002B23FFA8|nr:PIG-L deacetylase family protein [Citrobacter braakii]MEB0968030.1 PIG-L deacetylase family protein [Citrobacter braakii]